MSGSKALTYLAHSATWKKKQLFSFLIWKRYYGWQGVQMVSTIGLNITFYYTLAGSMGRNKIAWSTLLVELKVG
ncbi:hypothetical protein CR513_04474, partial [Mucuna pruriens]